MVDPTAVGRDDSQYSFDADMRFMQGTFVDTAERLRHGAFAFVCIDLFDPDGSAIRHSSSTTGSPG